jgi:uncharacterized protein with HEPN domain
LNDITSSCKKILKFTEKIEFKDFRQDELIYDAIIRNLEIIGEATKNLPEEVKSQFPGVEWRKISGLRDVIAHAYFGIDDSIIWEIIQFKIPHLLETISKKSV